MTEVTNNTAQSRYELTEEGETAFAAYRKGDGILTINYVESPQALRGKGTAGRLMEGVVASARAEKLKIIPICGYAAAWLRKHPENSDLLA
jgi:hypothetical protein